MTNGKSESINKGTRLWSVPEVYDRLIQIRKRFDETEEGTDQYLQMVPFIQFGVPYGEYLTLRDEGLLPREYTERDLFTGKGSKPSTDVEFFNRYVMSDATMEEGYSFVFFGANGSGKTMLALYILCGFIERGRSGYYLHFKDYMRIFNDTTYAREDGTQKLLQHLYSCELLVIDEIGKESNTTDNVVGEFERLLKERSANRLPTILVTNLRFHPANEEVPSKGKFFRRKYGISVHNILLQRYRLLQFSQAGDFRAKMRKEWRI